MSVSKIDTSAVCGHLRAMCAGIVPNATIQHVVGELVAMSPTDYVQAVTEIGKVFHSAIQGRFDIEPTEFEYLKIVNTTDTHTDATGHCIRKNSYNKEWINLLLDLPPDQSETTRIWAGMTNLKSAAVIDGLSRQEKKVQRDVITHRFVPDEDVVLDWTTFLHKYIPYLTEKLMIDSSRTYDRLNTVAANSKASRCVLQGQLKPCHRGSDDFCSLDNLRHPVVNKMLMEYPEDSAAALFAGRDVESVELNLPTPYGHLPVGSVAISPKVAQKPRVVWILVGALDSMSRPMFHKLEEIEERWNIQGVMDQDGARQLVVDEIRKNEKRTHPKVFCSYDQSAFTDNFSYDFIQRPVVKELVDLNILKPFDLSLLDEINHGEWEAAALGLHYETIKFGTGTGMGTPPSFPLASITNGLMVAYAYYKETGKLPNPIGRNVPGKVVGDDCIIFDERIGAHYESFCEHIGLKINKDKSFKSDRVAEFCGKYMTTNGIFTKKKLMKTSGLLGLRDQLVYYQDHAEDYYRAYPDVDLDQALAGISLLRTLPEPFGVLPEETDAPFANLYSYVTRASREAHDASNYVQPDFRQSRRDVVKVVSRDISQNSILRGISYPNDIDEPATTEPVINITKVSIARDIVHTYNTMINEKSWELIVQDAEEIHRLYDILRGMTGDPYHQDPIPHVTPKRVRDDGDQVFVDLTEIGLRSGGPISEDGPDGPEL